MGRNIIFYYYVRRIFSKLKQRVQKKWKFIYTTRVSFNVEKKKTKVNPVFRSKNDNTRGI